PLAILFRPLHNGARPRTGSTQATADWDGPKAKTARQVVLAEAQTAGDGATLCLNRGQTYGALSELSIRTAAHWPFLFFDTILTVCWHRGVLPFSQRGR